MNSDRRIRAFAALGQYMKAITDQELNEIVENSRNENPWFREDSIKKSLESVSNWLTEKNLRQWIEGYPPSGGERKIAIIMAGNIPLVGFHDLLAVLISGHSAVIKLSSKDQYLPKWLIEKLISIEPDFERRILLVDRLVSFDAVIATGSDNSARYFEYYFSKYPHIIRKNRTSVAVLSGDESSEELGELGDDVFTFYGLGCRNVLKLMVPRDYTFDKLFQSWEKFSDIINHHKYANNYDYQKSILLINKVPFFDNGFVLLTQSVHLVSPISVVYYDFYQNEHDLQSKLEACQDKIQIVVGNYSSLARVSMGHAQNPSLTDYADNVDVMSFLSELK